MSENKHTPEPWAIFDGDPRAIVTVANPMLSLLSVDDEGMATMFEQSDARRIVACVNACAGIPTYQLTAENDNPTNLGEVIDAIRNQRDELLAALERCRFALEPYDDIKPRDWKSDRLNLRDAHQVAVAAIAGVKGEQ